MIGRLAGRLVHRGTDRVLIDVGGVGYEVFVSDRTLAALPPPGAIVALYTDLLVREDLLQLYGFPTLLEREWHRTLVGVQGIGAKASMAILGTLGAEATGRAIALGDWAAIKAAPGVGPKTAQRVVNELKDKAPGVMMLGGTLDLDPDPAPAAPLPQGPVSKGPAAPSAPAPSAASAQAEALSALGNLGYAPSEAAQAVARAAGETSGADTTALIRAALKLLAPQG